ncbi:MAG TPA: VOC family protein [Ilumatobacteraceae bacterium]|nr:VOC family protein [Ilumatobacteraceae bacterium]
MAIRLDHTIIPARDGEVAARWFANLFGLAAPIPFSVFWQVTTANAVDLDFDTYGDEGTFTTGHYAFLVDEAEFDAIFGRITSGGIEHWADPGRRSSGEINHHDGGRGVYLANPDDHLLEIITVPYGGVAKPG